MTEDLGGRDFETGLDRDVVSTLYGPGQGTPLFIQPARPELADDSIAASAWVSENRTALDSILLKFGAFVLRGFAVGTTAAFRDVIASYQSDGLDYVGGVSPRNSIDNEILESTHAPPTQLIPIHQEMSYLPKYPNRVAFFCRLPPVTGGETLLADMRRYTKGLPKEFYQKLREKGVRYQRNLRAPGDTTGHPQLDIIHRTWTDTFQTDDRAEAEKRAAEMGMDFEWLTDGSLSISNTMAGIVVHPVTKEEISFHQIPGQWMGKDNIGDRYELYQRFYGAARQMPYNPTYGDGSPVDDEHFRAMKELANQLEIKFQWSRGDILVLDNLLTGHGRNAYTGERSIQVSLLN